VVRGLIGMSRGRDNGGGAQFMTAVDEDEMAA
jgi:hypothetical protein